MQQCGAGGTAVALSGSQLFSDADEFLKILHAIVQDVIHNIVIYVFDHGLFSHAVVLCLDFLLVKPWRARTALKSKNSF